MCPEGFNNDKLDGLEVFRCSPCTGIVSQLALDLRFLIRISVSPTINRRHSWQVVGSLYPFR